jgi:HK97 family phage portal protein
VELAKEAIGLSLAAEGFGADFFGNGANSDIILSYPGRLSPKGKENLSGSFDSQYRGKDSAKTMVLEEGTKAEKITFAPDASQFLQTRKFQIADIARFFRVPLHMINELDKSSFNNIEMQSIEFVIYTMLPWVEKWEQELDRKLFYESEKTKVFAKFNMDAILRGDANARATIMQAQFNNGALTPNEIRKANGYNEVPGGDTRYVNANLMPVGVDGKPIKDSDGEGD